MFEIVERILAALIILALLTLLIILAFPVPPRDTVAPAPSGETKQAERTDPAPKAAPPAASPPAPKVEPASPPPTKGTETAPAPTTTPAPAPKTDAKQTPAPKPEAPAPKKVVDRIAPSSPPPPVVVANEPRRPAITVRAKDETERVVYSREERVTRHRSRATLAARRERQREREVYRRNWREPVITGECEDEDCECCGGGCGKRPYWAEPRRQRWAQAPVGVCPY